MLPSRCAFLFSVLLFPALPVAAMENLFNVTAFTLQQGDGFEVGGSRRGIATLEHYGLWNWGDVYAFYDRIRETGGGRYSYYGELSPRLSLSLFGLDTRGTLYKDLLMAFTLERGSGDFEANLAGAGVTWDLPPFAHLETDLYYRDTRGLDGSTWQVTVAWVLPFRTGPLRWQFDGYLDARGEEGAAAGDLNFNPQLKLDLGHFFGVRGHYYAGAEYYHWNSKYGIEGVDERLLSPLLQVRFSF